MRPRAVAIALGCVIGSCHTDAARAETGRAATPPTAPAPHDGYPVSSGETQGKSHRLIDLERAPPPPTNVVYLQYGVAFTAEVVTAAGGICNNVTVPCILGTGGGITIRAGWRGTGALYLGGAYSFSKQDPNKLLRLAILQQARAEARYYLATGRVVEPYGTIGLGIAGYGSEWAVNTYGPTGFVGVGLEAQVTRRIVVGIALAYRLLRFKSFTDSSGADRDGGLARFVGLDFVLEQREPIFTQGGR